MAIVVAQFSFMGRGPTDLLAVTSLSRLDCGSMINDG